MSETDNFFQAAYWVAREDADNLRAELQELRKDFDAEQAARILAESMYQQANADRTMLQEVLAHCRNDRDELAKAYVGASADCDILRAENKALREKCVALEAFLQKAVDTLEEANDVIDSEAPWTDLPQQIRALLDGRQS